MEGFGGLFPSAGDQVLRADLDHRLQVIRLHAQRGAVVQHRRFVVAHCAVQVARADVQVGKGRLFFDQRLDPLDGLAVAPLSHQGFDLVVQERPVGRLHGDGHLELFDGLCVIALAVVQVGKGRADPALVGLELSKIFVLLDGLIGLVEQDVQRSQPFPGRRQRCVPGDRVAVVFGGLGRLVEAFAAEPQGEQNGRFPLLVEVGDPQLLDGLVGLALIVVGRRQGQSGWCVIRLVATGFGQVLDGLVDLHQPQVCRAELKLLVRPVGPIATGLLQLLDAASRRRPEVPVQHVADITVETFAEKLQQIAHCPFPLLRGDL